MLSLSCSYWRLNCMQAKEVCRVVSEFALPVTQKHNVELWDVEFEKEGLDYVLTVYIDSDDGISIETCEAVSRIIDPFLDEPQFSSLPPYTLCVSSAGLTRKLTKTSHFEKFIGNAVEVKFYKPQNGIKETDGTLISYNNDEVQIETDMGTLTFNIKDAAYVRLKLEF